MIPLPVVIVVGFIVALGLASVYLPGFGGSGEPLETAEDPGVAEVSDQPSDDGQAAGTSAALVQVTSPQAGSTVAAGESVVVGAVVASGTIQSLDVYIDGALVASTNSAGPVSFVAKVGTEQFTVLAILEDGTKASSAAVPITVTEGLSDQPGDTTQPMTDVDRAVAIFQQFEDAAAIGDWDRLRVLEPAKAAFTDQRWSDGYEMLEQAWVVPVRTLATDGSKRTERIGLVTNEIDLATGLNVSKLFCVTWSADLVAETMEQTGTNTVLFEPLEGYVPHTDYVEFLQATC